MIEDPKDLEIARLLMLLEAVEHALDGCATDFELSHYIVRRVDDLRRRTRSKGFSDIQGFVIERED